VIVEFCGVPGAGKSTLASALMAELRRTGHPAHLALEATSPRARRPARLLRKCTIAAGEVVLHPFTTLLVLRAVHQSMQPSHRDLVVRTGNWLVLRAAMRRARRSGAIWLFDQGVIQELCSLGYAGKPFAGMDVANPGLPRLGPDVIVSINLKLAEAEERIEARPGSESRVERSGTDRRSALVRQAALIESLRSSWLQQFGDRLPTRTLHVSNGDDGPRPSLADLAQHLVAGDGARPPAHATTGNGSSLHEYTATGNGSSPHEYTATGRA
jgi:hypothetical protein